MTERNSNALGIVTILALAGVIVMANMHESNIRTDMKLRQRTIECVTQPQKCKIRYEYYQLDVKK
jgi:hypothetical protein